MADNNILIQNSINSIVEQSGDPISPALKKVIETELKNLIENANQEGEFYKGISDEMLDGLRGIFKEITKAAVDESQERKAIESTAEKTNGLFQEASNQLSEILETTLAAAENIMTHTENLLERNDEAKKIFEIWAENSKIVPADFPMQALAQINSINLDSLTGIMTELSFQDLTGQRLKKVTAALSSIQSTVLDMYLSTGLMLKKREETPQKSLEDISKESRVQIAEMKNVKSKTHGPSNDGFSQNDVDSLLADLGL